MYTTNYIKASNTDEAMKSISGAAEGMLLAGGQTLLPTMKQRLASPDTLIDLSGCGLSGISDEGSSVKIGAMTTHASVASSDLVSKSISAVAVLAGGIGDRQVRNCGTIGGSVANNDPAACYPAAVCALGGTIHSSKRDIAAADYFTGMFETALNDGEIILAISLPKPDKAAYIKFPNPASRYAMVGVFLACFGNEVRVAVTGAGKDGVFRATELEKALSANFSSEAIDGISIAADALMSDIPASADYRASLILEMTKRAVNSC